MCNNVIKFVLAFRSRVVETRNHVIMFVCEKNQGGLPAEMYRALREYRPLLCNWIIYTDQSKDEFGGIHCDNLSKNKSSVLLNQLLNNESPASVLRFFHSISDEKIRDFLVECENERREISLGDKSPIRLFPKQGHRNDVLATVYNALNAYYSFSKSKKVSELSLHHSVIHRNCTYAERGHLSM